MTVVESSYVDRLPYKTDSYHQCYHQGLEALSIPLTVCLVEFCKGHQEFQQYLQVRSCFHRFTFELANSS